MKTTTDANCTHVMMMMMTGCGWKFHPIRMYKYIESAHI